MKLIFLALLIATTSYAGIIRQDVRNFSVSGQPLLIGPVTLSAGNNVTLTQIGQNISITAAASAGVTSTAMARFTASGGVGSPVDWFDGSYVCTTSQSLTNVQIGMNDSGVSGFTGVEIFKNLLDVANVTVTANSGQNSVNSTLAAPIPCVSGDIIHPSITTTATSGNPQDLTVQLQFQ